MENKKLKYKNNIKAVSKTIKPKNKTCKKFCKEVFLPERENVEIKFSSKYQPLEVLRKTNRKTFANTLESMYLKSCNDIYCQKSCKNNKKRWLKSFTKKRKEKLIQQGAITGCRDLIKEFPEYYKNI